MIKTRPAGAILLLAILTAPFQIAAPPDQGTSAGTALGVPIGAILPWWGLEEDIPEGFEACDGRVPTTRDAVLTDRKPDLRERFLRGATDYRSFQPRAFKGGGSTQVRLRVDPHALTASEIPGHAHGLANHTHANTHAHTIAPHAHTIADHDHPIGDSIQASVSGSGVRLIRDQPQNSQTGTASLVVAPTALTTDPSATPTGGPSVANTGFTGGTNSGAQGPAAAHTHTLSTSTPDLLPPYLDVIYIIRVK